MNKTLFCVQSGKFASFAIWKQSSELYLLCWIWAKKNYNNTVCTALVRVWQHFSVKSVDQNLMISLKSSMLFSSMKCFPWILNFWMDQKLRNDYQIQTFRVTDSKLQFRNLFWSLSKSRVHFSPAAHQSHWKKYDFLCKHISLDLWHGQVLEKCASRIYSVILKTNLFAKHTSRSKGNLRVKNETKQKTKETNKLTKNVA